MTLLFEILSNNMYIFIYYKRLYTLRLLHDSMRFQILGGPFFSIMVIAHHQINTYILYPFVYFIKHTKQIYIGNYIFILPYDFDITYSIYFNIQNRLHKRMHSLEVLFYTITVIYTLISFV